jgi:glutathione S-transferase
LLIAAGDWMTERLILYGSPHSLFTYKVALTLALSAEPFSFRHVSFQRRMHRAPEFLALSRWGQVPVLRCGERTLLQSAAILEYLVDALGKFGGSDDAARQEIREWLCWDADRLTPPAYNAYSVRLGELKLLSLAYDPAVVAHYHRNGEMGWTALNAHLTMNNFIAAPYPTIVDIACYAAAAFARLGQIDLTPWPHVGAWTRRVEGLPGFRAPFDLLAMTDAEIAP